MHTDLSWSSQPVACSIFFPFIRAAILPFDSVIDRAPWSCSSGRKKEEVEEAIISGVISYPCSGDSQKRFSEILSSLLFILAFIESEG